jgi:DNA-binding response OmpR family regulator
MSHSVLSILLTDDNVNEHLFFKYAIKNINENIKVQSFSSGKVLLDYLNDGTSPLPDILFLDVNMPLKNGTECLAEIRAMKDLTELPIVMYSTSDSAEDVDKAYENGANLYVKKPIGIDELRQMLSKVFDIYQENKLKPGSRNEFLVSSNGHRR